MSFSTTDTQLAVLKLLWEHGPATVRAITQELYPQCSAADIGTVHTLLQRLERKKLVSRDRSAHPHRFSAVLSQEELAGRELEMIAGRLTDGSMTPFLNHLIKAGSLTADEIREMRRLLSQASRKQK